MKANKGQQCPKLQIFFVIITIQCKIINKCQYDSNKIESQSQTASNILYDHVCQDHVKKIIYQDHVCKDHVKTMFVKTMLKE